MREKSADLGGWTDDQHAGYVLEPQTFAFGEGLPAFITHQHELLSIEKIFLDCAFLKHGNFSHTGFADGIEAVLQAGASFHKLRCIGYHNK